MNFENYELVSLSPIGQVGTKGFWDSYSYKMWLPNVDRNLWYEELKELLKFDDEDIMIALQKCFRWGETTEYGECWSIVARKFDSEPQKFIEIEALSNNVLQFNSEVIEGSVLRIKGVKTVDFLKEYFEINLIDLAF